MPMSNQLKDTITLNDLAIYTVSLSTFSKITGYSRQTVYRKLKNKDLPVNIVNGQYVFYFIDALKYKYQRISHYVLTDDDLFYLTSVLHNRTFTNTDRWRYILYVLLHDEKEGWRLDYHLLQYGFDALRVVFQLDTSIDINAILLQSLINDLDRYQIRDDEQLGLLFAHYLLYVHVPLA